MKRYWQSFVKLFSELRGYSSVAQTTPKFLLAIWLGETLEKPET